MELNEVMQFLESKGSPGVKNIYLNHGAIEPFWGVKVGDMKLILKSIKNDQKLAMQLFETGNSDAMYLAGLVANGAKMSKDELNSWAAKASWYMISEYTVPWVASESPLGYELALEWIDSDKETVAAAGWCTLSAIATIKPDSDLNLEQYVQLLNRVKTTIHQEKNRVRHSMNSFVIAVGSYILPLNTLANEVAKDIGTVQVNLGNTACKVASAPEYLKKMEVSGKLGQKRKTVKC
jgi:hypothetical protein